MNDEALTDDELVRRTSAGDRTAFRMVYERHSGSVLALAKRVLRNQHLAEEVTQDVFVQLWNDPDRYDPSRGSLRTFLLTMTHGKSVDSVRSETSRRAREEREARLVPVDTGGVDDYVERSSEADMVRSALTDLSSEQRDPIELAYFGGQTYREVAQTLGLPEGTVKSRIRIGMATLAKSMGSPA